MGNFLDSSGLTRVWNKIASTYLSKGGGTVTGRISRDSGGAWISARDNVIVYTTRTSGEGSNWHPVVGGKTSNGFWSLGSVGGESLCFSYDTDSDYSTSSNNNIRLNVPITSGGTLALTSQIPTNNNQLTNGAGYITSSGSCSYSTSAGSAGSAGSANQLSIYGYGSSSLTYYQTDEAFDGNSGWCHYIICNHGQGASYYHYTIGLPFWGVPIYKRQLGSTSDTSGWHSFITSENIGSQSVNYATSAGNADTVDSEHSSSFAHRASGNNLVHAGNEITMIPDSYSGPLWFNYQSVGRNSSSNITEYIFGNGNGGALATITSGQFSGNAASATQLQTTRTIWGQSFNGTGNVDGIIYITANGNTVTLGSQNSSWCHIYNSVSIPFIFNTAVWTMGGLMPYYSAYNIGESSNRWGTIYATSLNTTGNIYASGTISCGSASDSRLKDNIEELDLHEATNIISSLRPVSFRWSDKATELSDQLVGDDIGLVAQDVESLVPSAISSIFNDYLRLDYTKLIAPIIKVEQDLMDRVERLEKENEELKRQLKN